MTDARRPQRLGRPIWLYRTYIATRRQQLRSAPRELRDTSSAFPTLTGIDADGVWEGLFAMSADSLPTAETG